MILFMVWLILFLLVPRPVVLAMDPYKPINLYERSVHNMNNGLPSNAVNHVTQSRDGYFWFSTVRGAVRFDGMVVDVFNSENTAAFKTDTVICILEDSQGVLWMATMGSGIIRYQKGVFSALTTADGLLDNEVISLLESRDGAIWIGTSKGLNRYREGQFTVVPLPPSLAQSRVKALKEDRRGTIWVGTVGNGVLLTRCKDERLETEVLTGVTAKNIYEIIEDHMGRIWIATLDEGVICIKGKQIQVYNTSNGLPVNYVHSLLEDRAGNLIIGTYGGGFCAIPAGEDRVREWNGQNIPGCHAVISIFEDREGNIWMSTDTNGLVCFRDTPITTYTMENGLTNDCIFGVFQDSQENIWCGTIGFGLNRLNPRQNPHHFMTYTKKNGLVSDSIQSFAEYPLGTIWIGTLGGGITRYRLDTGRLDVIGKERGLLNDFVFSLYVDPQNTLWAGTNFGGLHRYDARSDRFELVANLARRVVQIHQDRRGSLWCGTIGNGLWRLYQGNRIQYGKKEGFQDDRVICIHEDNSGRMWFGTLAGGLNYWLPKENRFRHLGKANGLPINAVYGIIEDGRGHLWLSTDNGLLCLFRPDIEALVSGKTPLLKPYHMGLTHGMKGIDCSGADQPSLCRSRDGRLWIPTSHGLSVLDPENIQKNTLLPPVHIKQVRVDGTLMELTGSMPFQVPPGKGNLEIHYTAPSSIAPDQITFKYRLEGVDDNWVTAGTRRTAYYTLLPPGSYTFHVLASNSDGVWNSSGAVLYFRLKPRYYQTLAFKILAGLSLIGIALLVMYGVHHVIALRKQKRAFNGKVLPDKEKQEYLRKILYLLEVEKIYRDPNISVKTISSKLITSSRTISFIINDHLKKSFFELINHYRVEEARKMLVCTKAQQKSVIEIGYDVGFNSKSSFNRVFKNLTQMTPSEYRKKHGTVNSSKNDAHYSAILN